MAAQTSDKKLDGAGLATLWGLIKAIIPTVPTNVSSFTNDAEYVSLLDSHNANLVLASPNGASGLPSFRALVAADIPDLSGTYLTSSSLNGYATQSWVTSQGFGTVSSIKVGDTSYSPSSGVVSLPAYPTSLPASDVYSWAKQSTKPSYSYSEISGTPSSLPANGGNADTVGNIGASGFFRNFGTNGFTSCDSINAQGITTIDGYSQGPDSSANVTVLNLGEYSATRFKQLLFNYNNDNIYYRRNNDGNWTSWVSLITSSNIGSQSVSYANSAGSVAWGNVSGRPTALSSFTNDSGYITSSGSCAYATTAGSASSIIGYSSIVGDVGSGADSFSHIYDIPAYSMFSVYNADDKPANTGWVTGLAVAHNRNNNHYQTYLITDGSTWWTTGSYENGRMTDWKMLLTSANYSNYALPITGGSVSGNLTVGGAFTASSYASFGNTSSCDVWFQRPDANYFNTVNGGSFTFRTNSGADYILSLSSASVDSYKPIYVNGSVVWHAGNMGSGSGLNADLCDGYHLGFTELSPFEWNSAESRSYFKWYRISLPLSSDSQVCVYDVIVIDDVNYSRYGHFRLTITKYGEYSFSYQVACLGVTYNAVDKGHLAVTNDNSYIYIQGLAEWGSYLLVRCIFGNNYLETNSAAVTLPYALPTASCKPVIIDSGTRRVSIENGYTYSDGEVEIKGVVSGYLPLSGGRLTGSNVGVLEVNSTHQSETCIGILRNGTYKGWFGFADSMGTYMYNSAAGVYMYITDAGGLYFGGNTVWHAGNDGSGSGLDADLLDGYHEYSFLRYRGSTATNGEGSLWNQIGIKDYEYALPDGLSDVYNYGGCISLAGGNSRLDIYYPHIGTDSNPSGIWVRTGWANDKKSWKRLAFTSDIPTNNNQLTNGAGYITSSGSCAYASSAGNANTATQLQTSRTIWGQQFNGTADVYGGIYNAGSIEFTGVGSNEGHGGFIDFHYNGSSADYTSRIIEDTNGRLSINNVIFAHVNGNVGIGLGVSFPSYKLHVDGAVGATAFTNTSDIRNKDFISDTSMSIEQIANAPSFLFKWKTGDDRNVHAGSSAQYWNTVLPEIITTANDKQRTLSMQYDVIALLSSIAIAKEVVNDKEKIRQLEQRVSQLEAQLAN